MAFRVRITGGDKIAKNIDYLRREFPEWLRDANIDTAERVRRNARRNLKRLDAYDTHALYDSIQVGVSPKRLLVSVYSDLNYAPYVEFGTRPHFPPLEPIREWCRSRGIDESAAFPIARSISEFGTFERPFLYPAYREGIALHVKRIQQLVKLGLRGVLA